jgi:putative tryptophan/tyrosine transport system substrate-binding protein
MRRREFITVLGGAAALPFAARAQPTSKKIYRVGWFFSATPLPEMAGPDPISPVGKILVQGLRDLGYVEGQNLILDRVSAEGKYELCGQGAAARDLPLQS